MEFINLTPHPLNLNNGIEIPPSGIVARVSVSHSAFNSHGICKEEFGDVVNIPHPEKGKIFIVSGFVLSAIKSAGVRRDVVAPATGHHLCKRNDMGHILSVPGFVQ